MTEHTPTATDVLDPLERVIWCSEHGERPSRGEFQDAANAVAAFRLLIVAAEEQAKSWPVSARSLKAALDDCRAVGGAR